MTTEEVLSRADCILQIPLSAVFSLYFGGGDLVRYLGLRGCPEGGGLRGLLCQSELTH